MTALLIANRGEIALRIARAAAALGMDSVAVYSEDDAGSRHVAGADRAAALPGRGAAAYLDGDALIRIALETGADAVHPGYGFLSENAGFARACAQAGLRFVGPDPETIALFGDKARARAFARAQGVPVIEGSDAAVTLAEARTFLAGLGEGATMLIKAVAGGGGRGMRAVHAVGEVDEAYERCVSEAAAAFGDGAVYVERRIAKARHVEVQILGDGTGDVVHLWERDCSLQRRHQKLIEVAPAPGLAAPLRARLTEASVTMARAVGYRALATFEFLVDRAGDEESFVFLEVNPRLQVEHTITEEVTGIDLVQAQIRTALGASLAQLGLTQTAVPAPRGYALQARINMERMTAGGEALPAGGTLARFDPPGGPGVRVDSAGYGGYAPSGRFNSLLAKLIVSAPDWAGLVAKADHALGEFGIAGVETNIGFLRAILRRPETLADDLHTRFVETNAAALVAAAAELTPAAEVRAEAAAAGPAAVAPPSPDAIAVPSPMRGVVVSLDAQPGAEVRAGARIAVMEAMKMEHVVIAEAGGVLAAFAVAPGDLVEAGQPLAFLLPGEAGAAAEAEATAEADLDAIRPDLAETLARHAAGLDENRPEAVAKRRRTGQRTARENVADLLDAGSFVEYGALALAGQRSRRSLDDLVRNTPADGLIAGIGTVNRAAFPPERSRCMVLAYDYTVLAGTQGMYNHKKKDRLLKVNRDLKLPIILFAEGGGGRPGDVDGPEVTHLDASTFAEFARFSGEVPLVGIVSGRCFAGNVALLGCCDVIIATRNVSLGMAGPAMIEGGGLGTYHPDEIGPASVLGPNGVIDLLVEDEAEAVAAAKLYLSYAQGPVADWRCADQKRLRHLVPENRRRAYDVCKIVSTLADEGSVLELRREFGGGAITALARIEGRPIGIIANNPRHLGGAIDVDAADKAARFMQLCDGYGLPILTLVDTPGFMVGPDSERAGAVRHFARLFVNAAALTVPMFSIVLRKGYGLGANAVTGGGFHSPVWIVSWPSGEFGPMGLEGSVRLGFRRELEAVADPAERQALYEALVAKEYEKGKAINVASHLEIDDVIDPAESRRWIVGGLDALPPGAIGPGRQRRPCIDPW